MLGANMLAVLLPINGKTTAEISDEYPTLFTPANFTFSIWGLIYLTLLGFIVYQLRLAFAGKQPEKLNKLMSGIKDWFLVSAVANACWLFAWHYQLIPVSMALMLILLVSLIIIHLNLQINIVKTSITEQVFIQLPFSLYLGWIVIAALANAAALLVFAGWEGEHHAQVITTTAFIGIGTLASILMILLRNNIIYALVSVWAFYGILIKRKAADVMDESSIIHACVIGIGLIAITISWQFYRKQKS
ncbi:hypothetical protein DVR12_26115 [Chitinophaga silvatica]|uniref:Tryptophan-rich sensory protein n=2 Tax=Chitinophaga silvatica TaxID=2282649 RepID=A0A3E1Y2F1_9BACT|nr:hypothetical protein DVR12_26115 [Chitinophaga silvatica]